MLRFSVLLLFVQVCLSVLFCKSTVAQVIRVTQGSVSGRVKDAADMTNLPMATISVYKGRDTVLLKYQLNDPYGKFKMEALPLDSNLLLIVTYVGYAPFYKSFKLTAAERDITISNISLSKSSTTLKEVQVKIAPMVMRGDTLEFNADAFKANKNAVIGDLIKSLPGFIVWGDGKITVNGKQVSKVFVEGKEFFSGDSRISLNNIPKNAVNKIQVIPDKNTQDQFLGDTSIKTVTLNIGLKKNNKSGLFGKIGYGVGTNGRHEGEIMIAGFTPKTQLSVVGNINNTNRNTLNVSDMMVASSYKSGFSKNLFVSDFTRPGIIDQKSVGVIYNAYWNRHLRTKAQYDFNQINTDITVKTNSSTLLADSSVTRQSFSNSSTEQSKHSFNGLIEYRDSVFNIVSVTTNVSHSELSFRTADSVLNTSGYHYLNKTAGSSRGNSSNDDVSVGITYQHRGNQLTNMSRSKEDFDVKYRLDANNSKSDQFKENSFSLPIPGTFPVNREYNSNYNNLTHYLYFEYKNLPNLLGITWPGTQIFLSSELIARRNNSGDNVHNVNSVTSRYDLQNDYLTNANSLKSMLFRPLLSFQKDFLYAVGGRYVNDLSFSVTAKGQFNDQNNISSKEFRNISQNYSAFIPAANIYYTRRVVGENKFQFGISYTTATDIPTINQLAPLVDSTQQYQYYLGNRNLKAIYDRNFEISYNWTQETKNGLNLKLSAKTGTVKNYISDSSYYNNQGIRISYPVNVDGYDYAGGTLRFTKPFVINKNLFTYVFTGEIFQSHTPLYINGQKTRSVSGYFNGNSELGYTGNNIVAVYFLLWLNKYNSKLEDNSQSYKSTNWGTGLEMALEWPKRFHVGASANFNFNKYDYLQSTNLIIWNTVVSYRLSKREQFEVKLSANDILNQSAAIRNYVENNSIFSKRTNNLQRYFLLGLSYYPRFFGKQK